MFVPYERWLLRSKYSELVLSTWPHNYFCLSQL